MSKKTNQLIVEHYKKRFAQIMEYISPNGVGLNEDEAEGPDAEGGADMTDDMGAPADPNAMGGDPNAMGAPADPGAMGGDPNAMGAPADPNAMGGDPNAMGGDPSADVAGGFAPQEDMGEMDDNTAQPGDEVVDITDLTDAQEETQEELKQFDSKFVKAIDAIKSLEKLIRTNDSKIEALQDELKKRNPTPIEKMNNRAANSYPFNISPKDYWEEKEKTSNYSTEDDNNGKGQEQYTITNGDINNTTDWKSISDTLSDDFMYNQTLDKLLKL